MADDATTAVAPRRSRVAKVADTLGQDRHLPRQARRHARSIARSSTPPCAKIKQPGTGCKSNRITPGTRLKITSAQLVRPQLRAASAATASRSQNLRTCSPRRVAATAYISPPRTFPANNASAPGLHCSRRCSPACARAAVFGVEACPVQVEVDVSFGLPVVSDGRPAGCERPREPRPRAQRDPQLGLRVSAASRHRQPRAGRRAQGRLVVRSADRARHPRRRRASSSAATSRTSCVLGELSLDGAHPAGARRAADRRGGAARRAATALLLPHRQRQRGRRRRRARAAPGVARSPKPSLALNDPATFRRRRRGRRGRAAPGGGASTATSPTSAASCSRGARSRSPPPAATTCCSSGRRAPARR